MEWIQSRSVVSILHLFEQTCARLSAAALTLGYHLMNNVSTNMALVVTKVKTFPLIFPAVYTSKDAPSSSSCSSDRNLELRAPPSNDFRSLVGQ